MGHHKLFLLFFSIPSAWIIDSDSISKGDGLITSSNFGDFDKLVVSFIAVIILDGDLIIKFDDISTGRN